MILLLFIYYFLAIATTTACQTSNRSLITLKFLLKHNNNLLCVSKMGSSQSHVGSEDSWKNAQTIYEFKVKDIDGNEVGLDKYKGHPLLVVNVASNCGLTSNNYKQLNELYEKYEKDGLRILGFPSNQFNGQEPGCDVDIKEFAKKKKVQFDMFSKIDVNGNSADPLYKWLKSKQGFFGLDGIKWNFTKFLINKDGVPIKRYSPNHEPKDIEPDLKALL